MSAGDHKTILIANPCDAERVLLRHALEANGFKVLEAGCAKEAIESAMAQPTDLVLLDTLGWSNPGLATLTVLKHQSQTCRIPVVIFGQPQSKEQVAEAVRKGASTWIGRQSFNLDRFVQKLKDVASAKLPAPGAAATAGAVRDPNAPRLARITLDTVGEVLAEVGPLPALEFTLMQAMTTTAGKEHACAHIAEIVERDPCMTLALLSAAEYGKGDEAGAIVDTQQAIAKIGPQSFYRMVESVPPLKLNMASLWDAGCWWAHSVATARIAEMLSRKVGLGVPGVAANAGLLQDIGLLLLATYWPKYYGMLVTAAGEQDTVHPLWEKELIGLHHGEIAASVLRARGLPSVLCDAALVHHGTGTLGQMLTASSRVVSMIVQTAGVLADALFPADPPLASITTLSDEFDAAFRESRLASASVIDACRKIMAEIVTEVGYHFPQSTMRSFFHRREPLEQVAYFTHGDTSIDVVRLHLEVRSRELLVLDRRSLKCLPAGVPMVVNLAQVDEAATQVELLTSMMAEKVFDNRPGVVLLPAAMPDRLARSLVPASWRLVCKPAHASRLVRFLAERGQADLPDALCVA